jgi:hypothetical protein
VTGKFLQRVALIDLRKSEERTNAIRNREGLTAHPVLTTLCGCPDPDCGGWHRIITEVTVPTAEECVQILKAEKSKRRRT